MTKMTGAWAYAAPLAAVVLPIVTLTTAALADDDKTYPGAMCRLTTSTFLPTTLTQIADVITLINLNAVGVEANGAMLNVSPGPQVWICPAVREWMKNEPSYARITVQENGTEEEPVKCTFEARTYLGEGSTTGGKGTFREKKDLMTTPFTQAVVYEWGAGEWDALLSPAHPHGYYFFRCEVPGRAGPAGTPLRGASGVITYKVGEND
jgi:hypothetical protein